MSCGTLESPTFKPRVKAPQSKVYHETLEVVRSNNLRTVCEEAACPNIGECWDKRHATFILLGDICTRACAFCNIKTGKPGAVDHDEPDRVAHATYKMGLKHVVMTSVDRDDLPDGGATHFARAIFAIRQLCPQTTIEVLTPDFRHKNGALEIVVEAKPDVFNHNLETVPRLYPTVRPGARYFHSLQILKKAKELDPTIFTKSGLMVGLGEDKSEIYQVMDDCRAADVDFLTIGQYLQPTPKHHPVMKYVSEQEFKDYSQMGKGKGFLHISSSALTRSSYHAGDDFVILQAERNKIWASKHAQKKV